MASQAENGFEERSSAGRCLGCILGMEVGFGIIVTFLSHGIQLIIIVYIASLTL
jgi:hypothetical protein